MLEGQLQGRVDVEEHVGRDTASASRARRVAAVKDGENFIAIGCKGKKGWSFWNKQILYVKELERVTAYGI